jgi:hypothetical protein
MGMHIPRTVANDTQHAIKKGQYHLRMIRWFTWFSKSSYVARVDENEKHSEAFLDSVDVVAALFRL